MVERIMLFKLEDPSTRTEVAALTRTAFYDLEGLEELSVGLPADPASEKSWDMSVVMRFSSLARQNEALASSAFRNYLEQQMLGRYAVMKAWSFERST
jgi:hypothetical protein